MTNNFCVYYELKECFHDIFVIHCPAKDLKHSDLEIWHLVAGASFSVLYEEVKTVIELRHIFTHSLKTCNKPLGHLGEGFKFFLGGREFPPQKKDSWNKHSMSSAPNNSLTLLT